MKKIFLVGNLKDCKIVADAFERYLSSMHISLGGFIVKNKYSKEVKYKLYDFSEYYKIKDTKNVYFVQIRKRHLDINEEKMISLIHPTSFVINNSLNIGLSTVIMPKVILYQNINIGSYNVLMNCVKLGHDVYIGNNCFLNYYSFIGSKTIIKNHVNIGLKSSIRENICIENYGELENSSILLNNIGYSEKWKGIPAKKI